MLLQQIGKLLSKTPNPLLTGLILIAALLPVPIIRPLLHATLKDEDSYGILFVGIVYSICVWIRLLS